MEIRSLKDIMQMNEAVDRDEDQNLQLIRESEIKSIVIEICHFVGGWNLQSRRRKRKQFA